MQDRETARARLLGQMGTRATTKSMGSFAWLNQQGAVFTAGVTGDELLYGARFGPEEAISSNVCKYCLFCCVSTRVFPLPRTYGSVCCPRSNRLFANRGELSICCIFLVFVKPKPCRGGNLN